MGNITLMDEEGNEYNISREEPTTAFESLGGPLDLANRSLDSFNAVTKICHKFAS